MRIFEDQPLVSTLTILFLVCSILLQIIIGILFQNMIDETENMSATNHKILKQCKLKFINCFQLNQGVSNVSIFVDKFIHRMKFGWFHVPTLNHLSGQLMLLSVFCAGIGVCKGISRGYNIYEVLPFYIISFGGMYLYFSVTSIVDIKGRTQILKVNIIDYLENHMMNRLLLSEGTKEELLQQENALEQKTRFQEKENTAPVFSKKEEKELEELLKEFFA